MCMAKRRPLFVFFVFFVMSAAVYYAIWNRTISSSRSNAGLLFVQKPNGSCALPYFKVNTYTFSHGWDVCPASPYDCLSFHDKDKSKVTFKDKRCQYRKMIRKNDFDVHYSIWFASEPQINWHDEEILEVACPTTLISDQYCVYRKINHKEYLAKSLSEAEQRPKYPLNVIAIGLDSMSRRTFAQQMSKSVDYLMTELGGVQFYGYTIVGDGTTAAFLALLAGVFEEDVHETRRGFKGATSLDDLPFVWKSLHRHGYLTLHDETEPSTGTFQLRLLGFDKAPVHYYGRPFQLATTVGDTGNKYNNLCFGDKSRFVEGLDYMRQLFHEYSGPSAPNKFGVFFDGLLTHSETPRGELLDDDLLEFLRNMSASGHLDSTLVIFFSDHGPRYGHSRQTIYGKYEERSPFLAMAFPKSFRESHPDVLKNLRENADFTLTTPFDVHATFLDILGETSTTKHGQSLMTLLPRNRSCVEAGVAPHWCPCSLGEPLDPKSPIVVDALTIFLSAVNSEWLQPVKESCFQLKSARAIAANIIRPRGKMAAFQQTVDGHGRVPSFRRDAESAAHFLVVTFETQPGGGTWEATFDVDAEGGVTVRRSQVSRTNAYGHAADCVLSSYPHLRQFCICDFSRVTVV